MAATDARPVPKKGVAYRLPVAIFNTSGKIITGGITGADSEVSKDGAAFSDCTAEFVETGTSGCGYLELSSTEMNADSVSVTIKCTNTDAVDVFAPILGEEAGDIRVDLTQINGDSTLIDKFAAAVKANRIGTIVGTPTATEIQCTNLSDAQVDLYNGTTIAFLTGALAGSRARVTDYSKVSTEGVFTISAQPTTASAGDLIVLF